MWGTCKIVNFSWLLFSTLVIGQNLLTQKKHPFKVECKCILLRKRPSCRFMHSLCKIENIPMWTGGDSSNKGCFGRKTNLFRESGDFAGNRETWEIFREI